jgi:hypothetical protein
MPIAGADTRRDWRGVGSLLGLDVRLAELSLVRLSTRLPPRKPSLNEEDRRVFVEDVALVEPAAMTEAGRTELVSRLKAGRTRLASIRTVEQVTALADEIHVSSTRRALLRWIVVRDPSRLAAFFSPSELLWIGLEGRPLDPRLHAWGAPSESRLGCLCLRILDRRPWELLAGRWGTGAFASGIPDLNVRLSELLAQLDMPAPLLGPVLMSAALDFVNTAISRGADDRRGLIEFVQALTPARIEQYLALLTTDGPLVPLGGDTELGSNKTGVPQ